MSTNPACIKTRFLIISDTHSAIPANQDKDVAFRHPLPQADVLLHCGDLTMIGLPEEYEKTIDMLASIDAGLKLVIAGNHDISLDEEYYARMGKHMQRQWYDEDMPRKAKEIWTGERAKSAGVVYLEEGTHEFELKNGARLRVYASPYQPEFCDWAFPYNRNQDRYNPQGQHSPNAFSIASISNTPVPDYPAVDVMMTHGPPKGILDTVRDGEHVGCEHLLRAARRCRPQLHCFGHIHEGWGAQRVTWMWGKAGAENKHVDGVENIRVNKEKMGQDRGAFVDISREGGKPIRRGEETLMVNASIMTVSYDPWNGPWVVDLDLERAG